MIDGHDPDAVADRVHGDLYVENPLALSGTEEIARQVLVVRILFDNLI
jgi:hypothetical protein